MMGDDTWLQLFPHHFEKSFAYPSFNVKDLDTVDNGCIEHLVPSLNEGNWDVLIAHFLGVDHAGHIFGVNTEPMIHKLEQYNKIVEEVVGTLKRHSGPGGLHENTFFVVMGDHGQTLNGDHGGGSPEEVETSIFAMSTKNAESFLPPELDSVSCGLNMDAQQICIGTVEQLDFAVTMSAMLDVPFPFGSIGRINPQLYALGSGGLFPEAVEGEGHEGPSNMVRWMQHYVDALCINVWQVRRYIDVYSASSVIGFPSEDLLHVVDIYSQAQENWLHVLKSSSPCLDKNCASSSTAQTRQIGMYLHFHDSVIELVRSKWTEFNLNLMVIGLCLIFCSLPLQIIAFKRAGGFQESFLSRHPRGSVGLVFAIFVIVMRACSVLSNSYILEEGKVAIFFLGTLVLISLHYSFMKTKMLFEATLLLLLVCALRFIMEFGLSKQAASSSNIETLFEITQDNSFVIFRSLSVPIVALILLAYLLHQYISGNVCQRVQKYVIVGTIFCFVLIALHWILGSELFKLSPALQYVGRIFIPRAIYATGITQLVTLMTCHLLLGTKRLPDQNDLTSKTVSMLCAWSGSIILLSGKHGSVAALVAVGSAWCIIRLGNLEQVATKNGTLNFITHHSLPVTQWSLLAVALFFCTGHWCAFDGLQYGAAFVGFDEFMLVRQAILLTIDTFGFSLSLPILGLPLLVSH